MEQSPNPTQTFDSGCHFFEVERRSPNPLPPQNFKPAILNRIEGSKEKALTKEALPPKKLGVDFNKKTIKKESASTKDVSQKEMSQLTKGLQQLGLSGHFSIEELSKALESTSLDQKEELLLASRVSNSEEPFSASKIVLQAEKLIRRHNRLLQQIHTIQAIIKQKLQNSERVDACLVFMAINLACQK